MLVVDDAARNRSHKPGVVVTCDTLEVFARTRREHPVRLIVSNGVAPL